MAGACAWKGAGEVTPKGLYRRQGRVDEHSEISLSDDGRHRILPPWGLYLFKIPTPCPHHPHFCDRVNHDDVAPRMVTCDAFDCTQKESTTPKGVAFHTPRYPG